LRIATRKERQAPRTQRSRREAAPDANPPQANDNTAPPPADGAGPQ